MLYLFIRRVLVFFCIGTLPFALIGAGFLYFDPFKLIYNYSDYSYFETDVITNRDYISTEMFKRNINKHKYNSYMFASSRVMAFKERSWKKFLNKDDQVFFFDAAAESIFGIHSKIKFLDSIGVDLDNVIILICRDVTFRTSSNFDHYLFIKHPEVSRESRFTFYKTFINAYFNRRFLRPYYTYKVTNKYEDWMDRVLINYQFTFDTITNETNNLTRENEIKKNKGLYYSNQSLRFFSRNGETIDSVNQIVGQKLTLLREIKSLLDKNNTSYKIIISPLYDQKKFSNDDLKILSELFSPNLYDFSGKNSFTESKSNYYEWSHYRPLVGDSILNAIYQGSNHSKQ